MRCADGEIVEHGGVEGEHEVQLVRAAARQQRDETIAGRIETETAGDPERIDAGRHAVHDELADDGDPLARDSSARESRSRAFIGDQQARELPPAGGAGAIHPGRRAKQPGEQD